jgi:acyl carrier protein
MATSTEIKKIISSEIGGRVDINTLPDEAQLHDYGIDSLDKSSIFMVIEDQYGLSIPDDDMGELNTINDIVKYLNDR